ncbi:MAG: ATP-binding protein [Acidobacteriota bacterium]
MIISIASGKGGTGKTTVAVNLALALKDLFPLQFLDCDVEEPNAHFFLKPELKEQIIVDIPVPEIDEKKCDFCGKCAEICAYNALAVLKDTVMVFPELCHGCGGCSLLCPQEAIVEKGRRCGVIDFGKAGKSGKVGSISFIGGKLDIGQAMAPPVIRKMKKFINPLRQVIIDAPPGTSCPVIEAVKGSDFCLLVTEPTPFGLNDLRLAVETVKEMGIPLGVIINRDGAGEGDSGVEDYCHEENISVLMKIPLEREIAVAYSEGKSIIEYKSSWKAKFIELFEAIRSFGVRGKEVLKQ